jgi:hypothetical protein
MEVMYIMIKAVFLDRYVVKNPVGRTSISSMPLRLERQKFAHWSTDQYFWSQWSSQFYNHPVQLPRFIIAILQRIYDLNVLNPKKYF